MIWFVRNQLRYHDRHIPWKAAVNLVIAKYLSLSLKTKKLAYNFISEFSILKNFNITIHLPKPPNIIEVVWHPPTFNWIKCNIDRAAAGTSSMAACGGLFRNQKAICIGCFAQNLGPGSLSLSGVMQTIEIAHNNG